MRLLDLGRVIQPNGTFCLACAPYGTLVPIPPSQVARASGVRAQSDITLRFMKKVVEVGLVLHLLEDPDLDLDLGPLVVLGPAQRLLLSPPAAEMTAVLVVAQETLRMVDSTP